MKSFFILLTVLVLAISSGTTSLAQSDNNSKEQIQQLEARLPGTMDRERFDILVEFTDYAWMEASRNSEILIPGIHSKSFRSVKLTSTCSL